MGIPLRGERPSLNSYSPDVCCSVLSDPCIHPGDRSTGLGDQRHGATLKLEHKALGRGWVEELCPVFQP